MSQKNIIIKVYYNIYIFFFHFNYPKRQQYILLLLIQLMS